MLFDRPHYVFSDTIILLSDTILLIEARIFDISIDSFSLNLFFIFMTTIYDLPDFILFLFFFLLPAFTCARAIANG